MRNKVEKSIAASLTILVILIMTPTNMGAFEPLYVGFISDGLFAPTSLDIDEDRLAVLEPFKRQISLYTPDGQVGFRIDIAGDASGLSRISQDIYLFCDRDEKEIIEVNIQTGNQNRNIFSGINLIDPIDIEMTGNRINILDAGSKEIVTVDLNRNLIGRFILADFDGKTVSFPSNFIYSESAKVFYIFDQTISKTWMFSQSGEYRGEFSAFGGSDGEISRGGDIACDPDGNIYIVDRFQGRIAVFDTDGEFISNINLADFGQANLALPTGIDIDDQGFVYVSSTEGRKIDVIFVNPENSPRRVLSASQAYPADNDTVEANDLELIAYIEYNPQGLSITGIDFQIYAGGDTSELINENLNVSPDIEPGENSEAVISRWLLEEELKDRSSYNWRVRAISGDIVGEWSALFTFHTLSLPKEFSLHQNYPNPFNPMTHIAFETPVRTDVAVTIYNTLGQKVKSFDFNQLPPGMHDIIWDGRGDNGEEVASGIYFYRMTSKTFNKTRKMAVLK
jgi:hypothetical protein